MFRTVQYNAISRLEDTVYETSQETSKRLLLRKQHFYIGHDLILLSFLGMVQPGQRILSVSPSSTSSANQISHGKSKGGPCGGRICTSSTNKPLPYPRQSWPKRIFSIQLYKSINEILNWRRISHLCLDYCDQIARMQDFYFFLSDFWVSQRKKRVYGISVFCSFRFLRFQFSLFVFLIRI